MFDFQMHRNRLAAKIETTLLGEITDKVNEVAKMDVERGPDQQWNNPLLLGKITDYVAYLATTVRKITEYTYLTDSLIVDHFHELKVNVNTLLEGIRLNPIDFRFYTLRDADDGQRLRVHHSRCLVQMRTVCSVLQQIKDEITNRSLMTSRQTDNLKLHRQSELSLLWRWDLRQRDIIAGYGEWGWPFTPNTHEQVSYLFGLTNRNNVSMADILMTSEDPNAQIRTILKENLWFSTLNELRFKINALYPDEHDDGWLSEAVEEVVDKIETILYGTSAPNIEEKKKKLAEVLKDALDVLDDTIKTKCGVEPFINFRRPAVEDKTYSDYGVTVETTRLLGDIDSIFNGFIPRILDHFQDRPNRKNAALVSLKSLRLVEIGLLFDWDVKRRDSLAKGKSAAATGFRIKSFAELEALLGLPGEKTKQQQALVDFKEAYVALDLDLKNETIRNVKEELEEIKEKQEREPDKDGKPGKKKNKHIRQIETEVNVGYVAPPKPEYIPGEITRELEPVAKSDKRYIFALFISGQGGIDLHHLLDEVAISRSVLPYGDNIFAPLLINALSDVMTIYRRQTRNNQANLETILNHPDERLQVLFKNAVAAVAKKSEMNNVRVAMGSKRETILSMTLHNDKKRFMEYILKN